jgi:hypothetical protein
VLEKRAKNILVGAILVAVGVLIIWLNVKGKDVEGNDLFPED